jgi:drug/metabolite transporter superfamily protein YnfA
MIGHWKIAVGMGGMWLLLILNYIYLLKSTQPERRIWMGVGLCILEGELIEIVASYFIAERFRLAYFMILGALAAVISILHIYSILITQKTNTKKKRQGSGGITREGKE